MALMALRASARAARQALTLRPAAARRAYATTAPATSSTSSELLADQHASSEAGKWLGTTTNGGRTLNYVGGKFEVLDGDAERWIEVKDPSTQRVLTLVPESTQQAMTRIVDKAEQAFLDWRDSSVLRRQGVMLKYVLSMRPRDDDHARRVGGKGRERES